MLVWSQNQPSFLGTTLLLHVAQNRFLLNYTGYGSYTAKTVWLKRAPCHSEKISLHLNYWQFGLKVRQFI